MPAIDANRNASRKAVKKAKVKRPPAPKVKAPSKAVVKRAQTQQQQYVSQGRAVEKAGNEQRKVRVARQKATAKTVTRAGDNKSDADRKRGTEYVRKQYIKQYGAERARKFYREGTTVPPLTAARTRLRKEQGGDTPKLYTSAARAPVLTALEQTTRPLHGIAAAERSVIKSIKTTGHPDPVKAIKAAGRGLANKDKSTASDVLGDLGVKNKTVKSVGGFALDVVGDPTTYVTGGAGSIARRSAEKAATRVEKKALDKGLTSDQAKRMGDRARKRVEQTGDQTKGVTVTYAGREVPGVRVATAHASKPVRKAAAKVIPKKARGTARSVVADVNPNAAPVGVAKETSRKAVQATRTARGTTNRGARRAVHLAHGIKKQIGEDNYNAVVDAIEAGKIRRLPEHLRSHAVTLRSEMKHVRRVQRRAGVAVADATKSPQIKGYVPRQLTEDAKQEAGKTQRPTVIKPQSSKRRTEKRPLAVVREEQPGKYREDLHALAADRVAEGSAAAAKSTLAQDLADLGRPVKRGQDIHIADGEAVYHVKAGAAPREVTDKTELARANRPLVLNKKESKVKGATPKQVGAGRYVVLNKELVEKSVQAASPAMQGPGIVHALDKTTAGFKRLAIATPGFHVRNLVGDIANAYLGQPTHRLPGNMRRAGKVLKAHGAGEKAMRQLKPSEIGQATLKTKRYGNVTYDEVAKELAQRGAFRSGYIAGELRELSASGGKSTGKIAASIRKGREAVGSTRAGQFSKRLVLNREDLPRLATAMEQLRRGASWEEAARGVSELHFDYQHLTNFERQIARRAAPFYTWSARNIPLQARKYVTRPGKYANFQKIREESAKASGVEQQDPQTKDLYRQLEQAGVELPGGYEKYLSEWEQRNAGIPLSLAGKQFTVSSGLPLSDLNELPGAALGHQLDEWYQKGMSLTGPIPKYFVEFFDNHSFFFRDQLERDNSPLVAAPAWANTLPGPIKKAAGLTPDYIDKKTGKKTWGWKGKADYVFSAIPGTPNYIKQLSTGGTDRRGKSTGGKLLGWVGLKSVPVDPVKNAVNLAYARLDEIGKRKSELNQTGVGVTKGRQETPEYRKLLAQEKVLKRIAYTGKAAQGYKVLPSQGGPSVSTQEFKFDSGTRGFKFDQGSSGFKFK